MIGRNEQFRLQIDEATDGREKQRRMNAVEKERLKE